MNVKIELLNTYNSIMQKYAIEIEIHPSEYKDGDYYDDDGDYNNDDTLISLTNLVNDKYSHIKRGDAIRDCSNTYRNTGRYFWDGENVIDMETELDDYQSIPLVFSYPEFSPTYFRNVIDHNTICNIDLFTRQQIKSNMICGMFPKHIFDDGYDDDSDPAWTFIKKPHPNPYPHHIAYSWFNQDIKWLDSNRYNEIKNAIIASHDTPDVSADLIMQFMGKTCWVRGNRCISTTNTMFSSGNMFRCQCKLVMTGDNIPSLLEPPLKTQGNIDNYIHCLNPETHVAAMKKEFLSINYFDFINDELMDEDFVDYDIITASVYG